eukprot:TRINITY_DN8544_c0_g1_i2.p1 TRINITY_DN8544_c0_g1~~TRINITY_DN8544_c0_g1_i2.p1  ORF type:complete len:212 (+),score=28.00 TRINITY_DN8544_c0_g1_i2:86-721(+)
MQLGQRYKLVIQYRGTNFIGWQKQPNETKKRSVQSLLEAALRTIGRDQCEVVTAGRTDSGVHAYANCAHVDIVRRNKKTEEVMKPFSAGTLKKATNYYLKKHTTGIYVSKVEAVNPDFHARFHCLSRTYVYRIIQSHDVSGLPFIHDMYHFYDKDLDLEKMKAAAKLFVGTLDFSAFSTATPGKSPIRTVLSIDIETEKTLFGWESVRLKI